jgi:acetyl esterase/lipase
MGSMHGWGLGVGEWVGATNALRKDLHEDGKDGKEEERRAHCSCCLVFHRRGREGEGCSGSVGEGKCRVAADDANCWAWMCSGHQCAKLRKNPPMDDRSVLTRAAPGPSAVFIYGEHADNIIDIHGGDDLPVVLAYVHGGYWHPDYDRTHARAAANDLPAHGVQVASIEYRRIPGAPDAMVEDVCEAVRAVVQSLASGRPVVLCGHSAGGHLALVAAAAAALADVDVHHVVALAPVADLCETERDSLGDGAAQAMLGCAAETRPDLDPMRLPALRMPVYVLHGDRDPLVPFSMGERYAAAKGATFVPLLGGIGHFGLIDPLHAVWPRVVEAILSGCDVHKEEPAAPSA